MIYYIIKFHLFLISKIKPFNYFYFVQIHHHIHVLTKLFKYLIICNLFHLV